MKKKILCQVTKLNNGTKFTDILGNTATLEISQASKNGVWYIIQKTRINNQEILFDMLPIGLNKDPAGSAIRKHNEIVDA